MNTKYLLLPSLLLISINTYAKCEYIRSHEEVSIPLGNFQVSPTLPIGTAFASKTIPYKKLLATCTSGGGGKFESFMWGNSTQPSPVAGIYETGIPGIGVKVSDIINPDDQNQSVPNSYKVGGSTNLGAMAKGVKVTFYRTGKITPDQFKPGVIAKYRIDGKDVVSLRIRGGSVKTKSCYATVYDVTVPLGPYSKRDFIGGIGSMTPEKRFDVKMTCEGDNTPVYVSFESVGSSSGDGRVPLSADSTASGVEFLVWDKTENGPLKFNRKTEYHTNNEDHIKIPFSVRFIQSAENIKPGKANGAMTFTVTQN